MYLPFIWKRKNYKTFTYTGTLNKHNFVEKVSVLKFYKMLLFCRFFMGDDDLETHLKDYWTGWRLKLEHAAIKCLYFVMEYDDDPLICVLCTILLHIALVTK